MRNQADDLLSIGNFSRMSRLSIKALRLYDSLGLLAPAWVDPSSGYRYYRRSQANPAEAIRILRMLDMPLDEIRELVDEDDPALVEKRLATHRDRLVERLADQERMLRFLERLIERGGTVMPYEVSEKHVQPQSVASVRFRTSLRRIGDDVAHGFATLVAAIGQASTQPAGPPFMVSHDVIDEQTDGDVELCIPVPVGVEAPHEVVSWRVLPGGTVASTVHRGPYGEVSPAYHSVSGWIEDNGRHVTGGPREIYLNDPRTVAPEDLLTEVQFPIDDPD